MRKALCAFQYGIGGVSMRNSHRPTVTFRLDRLVLFIILGLLGGAILDIALRTEPMSIDVSFVDGYPAACIGLSLEGVITHPMQYAGGMPALHIAGTNRLGQWSSMRADHIGIYRLTVFDDHTWKRPRWSSTFLYWPPLLTLRHLTIPYQEATFPTGREC
jgi:hypothetical protein